MTERWLPIPGYEDSYEVSSIGRVRSLDRMSEYRNRNGETIRRAVRGRLLKTRVGARGYPYVNLSKGNRNFRSWVIHRLVLLAFVGPLPVGLVSRHLNGIRTDNRLENLCYGTYSENMSDMVSHGTHSELRKTHCKRGHELTVENCNASQLKRGRRDCIACQKFRNDEITRKRRLNRGDTKN